MELRDFTLTGETTMTEDRRLWCKHWNLSQAGVLGLDVDHAPSTAFQISGAVLFLTRSLPNLN